MVITKFNIGELKFHTMTFTTLFSDILESPSMGISEIKTPTTHMVVGNGNEKKKKIHAGFKNNNFPDTDWIKQLKCELKSCGGYNK